MTGTHLRVKVCMTGFPTGVANTEGLRPPPLGWGGWQVKGGGSSKFDGGGGAWGELKMLSKNTSEGVHLIVKLPPMTLQASEFTKNELIFLEDFS